jgi:hypothetical protein
MNEMCAWRLQAGTSVYILTLGYVTSILPSRFDEILSIVGIIGCEWPAASMHRQLHLSKGTVPVYVARYTGHRVCMLAVITWRLLKPPYIA